MKHRHVLTSLAILLLTFTGHLLADQPAYTITNLGTLGGTYSTGYGINNSGQVTGWAENFGLDALPFLYSGGMMSDLGSLGGTFGIGFGINNSGQVAGYSYTAGDNSVRAFLHSGEVMNDLGTLGGSNSEAYGINDIGQVTGSSSTSGDSATHAFVYFDGGMTDLGTLGGSDSYAYGINGSGQVTGSADNAGGNRHAFLYSDGGMTDLGTLGGSSSQGTSINDSGQVTGYSYTAGGATHAFLFSGEVMTDLGTLGGSLSAGVGINESGQVTGYSFTTGNAALHGFLYSDGTMYDLNDLVGETPLATNIRQNSGGSPINDWGQIAAQGTVGGGTRALLLNPVDPNTVLTSIEGSTSRNTKFVGGMSYDKFTATTNTAPESLGTTVSLLDGTTGSGTPGDYGLNRDVNTTFTGGDNTGLASDILELSGTFDDGLVLALTYDNSLYGDNVALGWFDGNDWVLAVDGNTGSGELAGFYSKSYADFLTEDGEGVFDSIAMLGAYGTYGGVAWAVINHNSDFAAIQAVPEPSTFVLFALGAGSLLSLRRRKKRQD